MRYGEKNEGNIKFYASNLILGVKWYIDNPLALFLVVHRTIITMLTIYMPNFSLEAFYKIRCFSQEGTNLIRCFHNWLQSFLMSVNITYATEVPILIRIVS